MSRTVTQHLYRLLWYLFLVQWLPAQSNLVQTAAQVPCTGLWTLQICCKVCWHHFQKRLASAGLAASASAQRPKGKAAFARLAWVPCAGDWRQNKRLNRAGVWSSGRLMCGPAGRGRYRQDLSFGLTSIPGPDGPDSATWSCTSYFGPTATSSSIGAAMHYPGQGGYFQQHIQNPG